MEDCLLFPVLSCLGGQTCRRTTRRSLNKGGVTMSPYFSWEEIPSGRPLAHTGGPRFKVKYISHRGGLPLEASTLVSSVSGLRARSEATKQTPESKVSPYKMRVKRPPTPCSRSCVAADIEPGRRGATSTKSNKPLTFANPALSPSERWGGPFPGLLLLQPPCFSPEQPDDGPAAVKNLLGVLLIPRSRSSHPARQRNLAGFEL